MRLLPISLVVVAAAATACSSQPQGDDLASGGPQVDVELPDVTLPPDGAYPIIEVQDGEVFVDRIKSGETYRVRFLPFQADWPEKCLARVGRQTFDPAEEGLSQEDLVELSQLDEVEIDPVEAEQRARDLAERRAISELQQRECQELFDAYDEWSAERYADTVEVELGPTVSTAPFPGER